MKNLAHEKWMRRALESAAVHERRPYPSDIIERMVKLALASNDRTGAEQLLRDVVAALRQTPDPDPVDLKFATERLAEFGGELP